MFRWVLELLAEKGLVKGKTVGIDATTLEENAAMRSIVRRDAGEGYEEFLQRLAIQPDGTANVFCGVQPKGARYFPKVTANRSPPAFADYLLDIATHYPEADTLHLVLDNLNSYTRKAVKRWWSALARKRNLAAGSIYLALHPQTRQLAEPS